MNTKRFITSLILILLSAFVACGGADIRPHEELNLSSKKTTNYVVKTGDILAVQVWGEPKLSGEVVVRQDGYFSNPLVNDVPAEGLTLQEISEELSNLLQEFVPGATANVALVQSAPTVYYLSGQFLKPGEYRTDKNISLLQAIATGGGFAPFADESSIMLIRRFQGTEKRFSFDYQKLVNGKQTNPDLITGDVISIR